ncbi:MAG: phosphohydrolase [Okeania sp. SIO1H4]|uniref:Phosphohydrolase n=2 Tax=Microcoleaceae TaxID=1892252 RepID=A0A3N6RQ35_9CYAN|nr:phosphohydrolase [Okeania sp. SIO1H4]NET21122.1 phosphohydrolase [Okeania sp. SIO1H5]NET78174.1 phosphohydrolase [Okeania sp. SIO1F9]NET93776.1 phosphohydrolase [Okeania sp. SIO1H2]RQH12930.1 phosphohydrolase [Okeania hirsuta]
MKPDIKTIIQILSSKGHIQYNQESISQLEHALQCATLAKTAKANNELIVACLFHDLGHLIHDLGEDAANKGINDHHEYRSIKYLKHLFGEAVTEPIRLHVEAKRYLCATKPNYFSSLSPASQQSLELQGGIFSSDAAAQFIHQPYAKDAVKLRIWDDQAKVVGFKTPDLKHFTQIILEEGRRKKEEERRKKEEVKSG